MLEHSLLRGSESELWPITPHILRSESIGVRSARFFVTHGKYLLLCYYIDTTRTTLPILLHVGKNRKTLSNTLRGFSETPVWVSTVPCLDSFCHKQIEWNRNFCVNGNILETKTNKGGVFCILWQFYSKQQHNVAIVQKWCHYTREPWIKPRCLPIRLRKLWNLGKAQSSIICKMFY